jgi:hypothetical protein
MITVLAAVLLCVAFHLSSEGRLKVQLASNTMIAFRLGRFMLGIRAYRPGRLYFRTQWKAVV